MSSTKPTPSKRDLQKFAWIMAAAIPLVFGLLLPWLFGRSFPRWPWITAGVFLAASIVAPLALKPVFHGWLWVGHWLGYINTRIILGLIFFLIFTPAAFIVGILGKRAIQVRPDPSQLTYRKTCATDTTVSRMRTPY